MNIEKGIVRRTEEFTHSACMQRRDWFKASGAAACALIAGALSGCGGRKDKPSILLCSSWQTANIGDIAHTPGLIELLQKHLPDHSILLWPKRKLDRGADGMLRHHFPDLQIIDGSWEDREVRKKLSAADFLLHGSGPSVLASERLAVWKNQLGKPFGIFGVTISDIDSQLRNLLDQAEFVYTRETRSLDNLRVAGVTKPVTGFAPDATFAMSIRDDARAEDFIMAHDLKPGNFICAVPRLRKTPYYKIYPEDNHAPEEIGSIDRLNSEHAETDHAKLRVAMIRWVRETGGKVAVVPEMTYELDIMDELLFKPLPEDVRANVVLKETYWLPDEAASLYARAAAILSFECHSPIMAVKQGTPALYLRQPQDTIKGQMWYDLGFGDWVFEIEQADGEQIAETLMSIHSDNSQARDYLDGAMTKAADSHSSAMTQVRKTVFG